MLTKGWSRIREFGPMNIIWSVDFIFACIILVLLVLDKLGIYSFFIQESTQKQNFVQVVFSASSILFTLATTSLSIILSFSTSNFIKFVRSKNNLSNILFPFWLGNSVFLANVLFSALYLMINPPNPLLDYIFIISVTLFIYGIGISFSLLGTIIKIGEMISLYEDDLKKYYQTK